MTKNIFYANISIISEKILVQVSGANATLHEERTVPDGRTYTEADLKKVFIDGSSGTTGIRIYERLSARKDIELIRLAENERKDENARRDAINRSDVSILCLPDDAARAAAEMADNPETVIIDTSTAHRCSEGWVYGFPEIRDFREKIKNSKRIANPGCHASGFIALVAPLIEKGLIERDAVLTSVSLTGYSGGGKKMIAEYESDGRDPLLDAPRQYGLTQNHKHLPEMKAVCGLDRAPFFIPVVASFYSGMEVTVTLPGEYLADGADAQTIFDLYREYYTGKAVFAADGADENGFLSAAAMSGRDDMQIGVFGNGDRIILVSRFDNLGKGASGAAVQNLYIALGADEYEGLVLE